MADDLSAVLKKAAQDPAEQQARGIGTLHKFYAFLERYWASANFPDDLGAPWKRRLVAQDIWEGLDPNSNLYHLGVRFAQFDKLADRFQFEYRRRLTIICSLALGFLVSFELFAHASPQFWFLDLALLFLLGAYFSLGPLRSKEVQAGYLCSRCVSECLRVQFFFLASEIPSKISEITNNFSDRHARSISFVRPILKVVSAETVGMRKATLEKTVVERNWIKGQEKYFEDAIYSNVGKERLLKTISNTSFIFGVICIAALAVIAHKHPGEIESIARSNLALGSSLKALLTLGPSLIAVAAVIEFISERRGFKANAERYSDIRAIFSTVDPDAPWTTRIERIGLDCLAENIDWYVSSMQREITVPKG
jgi:hypothetical protein